MTEIPAYGDGAARSRWRPRGLALVAGLLAVGSQPPLSVPWVLALSLPALFLLWRDSAAPRAAFGLGWFAGLGYFGAGLYWIAEAFLVEPELFGWMIPFALFFISGGLALFWGAGFWLAKRICGAAGGYGAALILAACWMAMETARGHVFTGFPWGLLGYAWVETPAMQTAAVFGAYGVTLWTVLAGVLLGAAAAQASWAARALGALPPALIVSACWIWGADRLSESATYADDATIIGIAQPNTPQRDKWNPDLAEGHLRGLLAQTRALSERGAQVVIWPEAATAYLLARLPGVRGSIGDVLNPGAVALIGAQRVDNLGEPDQRAYNSLLAITASGEVESVYDKRHLVPFGEYIPFSDLVEKINLRALVAMPGGFSSGVGDERLMRLSAAPPLIPMICYEAIFPGEISLRASPAQWMAQVTNDAWFGASAGPYQHLAQARVRAIERGLPLARAANTGVSALVDGKGRLHASLGLGEHGIIASRLPRPEPSTLYARYENTVHFAFLAMVFGVGFGSLTISARNR